MLEYFLQNGKFAELETLSVEGYPRPDHDPLAMETDISDPAYAIWVRRACV